MEVSKNTIAVLLTCHNRRETTLKCLNTLFNQENIKAIDITVYLVDDGSTDGTTKAVGLEYPQVNILKGDGSLYWNGGMRKAMNTAMKDGYDFYLWLNDDTVLYTTAIQTLLKTYNNILDKEENPPIISGNLWDPQRNKVAYGGWVRLSKWNPFKFRRLTPGEEPKKCDVINGNVVLLSSQVVDRVGNLHPELTHVGGDFDYALRAQKKGTPSYITAGYVGKCPRNSIEGTYLDESLSLIEKYKKLLSAKGRPFYPTMLYFSEHGGFFWPFLFAKVYLGPLWISLKELWQKIKK